MPEVLTVYKKHVLKHVVGGFLIFTFVLQYVLNGNHLTPGQTNRYNLYLVYLV
jgi:hypothetical protein